MNLALSRLQIHFVWVDDLTLLLQVERNFVVLRKSTLALEFLLVV